MRPTRQETNRSVLVVLGLLAACAMTAWWACGDSGTPADEGCNPPCAAGQVCIEGVCFVEVSDGGGEADATSEAEAEAVAEVEEEDAAPESDFTVVEGTDDADGRSDVDPSLYNVGESCGADGECRGPGDATCMTTIDLGVFYSITFPGGYCSSTCDGADPMSCGAGAVCVSISFIGLSQCFQSCTPGTAGECRESDGYTCFDPSTMPYVPITVPVCIPPFM